MGCCSNSRKNEEVSPQQRWEYINLADFHTRSCWTPFAYIFFFVTFLFGIAGVVADGFTAVNLLIFNKWSSKIQPAIDFRISKWIFAGCIIFSFVLRLYRVMIAIRVVRSKSVSKGYLDLYAQRWWSVGSGGWKRFLVFAELTKSKHGVDYVILFTYFSFKGWAETIIANGPRQVLNAITLYSVLHLQDIHGIDTKDLSDFTILWKNIEVLAQQSTIQVVILSTMAFTLVIWAFTMLQLIISIILWVLFVWHKIPSQHGLSSYCQEKIDKRLKGIVAKNNKKIREKESTMRIALEKDGKLQKPTLPIITTTELTPNGTGPSPHGLLRSNTSMTSSTSTTILSQSQRPSAGVRGQTLGRSLTAMSYQSNDSQTSFGDTAALVSNQRAPPNGKPLPYPGEDSLPAFPLRNNSDRSLTTMAPVQPYDFVSQSINSAPMRAMTSQDLRRPSPGPGPMGSMDRSTPPPRYMSPHPSDVRGPPPRPDNKLPSRTPSATHSDMNQRQHPPNRPGASEYGTQPASVYEMDGGEVPFDFGFNGEIKSEKPLPVIGSMPRPPTDPLQQRSNTAPPAQHNGQQYPVYSKPQYQPALSTIKQSPAAGFGFQNRSRVVDEEMGHEEGLEMDTFNPYTQQQPPSSRQMPREGQYEEPEFYDYPNGDDYSNPRQPARGQPQMNTHARDMYNHPPPVGPIARSGTAPPSFTQQQQQHARPQQYQGQQQQHRPPPIHVQAQHQQEWERQRLPLSPPRHYQQLYSGPLPTQRFMGSNGQQPPHFLREHRDSFSDPMSEEYRGPPPRQPMSPMEMARGMGRSGTADGYGSGHGGY